VERAGTALRCLKRDGNRVGIRPRCAGPARPAASNRWRCVACRYGRRRPLPPTIEYRAQHRDVRDIRCMHQVIAYEMREVNAPAAVDAVVALPRICPTRKITLCVPSTTFFATAGTQNVINTPGNSTFRKVAFAEMITCGQGSGQTAVTGWHPPVVLLPLCWCLLALCPWPAFRWTGLRPAGISRSAALGCHR
jgi:hypothetical protein